VARDPKDIPGYDRLTVRTQRILRGESVYDIPVDQRGTVSRDISQGPSTPRPPQIKAIKSIDRLKLNMTQARDVIGSPALTNHYYVDMPIPGAVRSYIAENYGKELQQIGNFISNKLSFFRSGATLPGTSYATAEVKDNFMGVPQEFAHTRLYTDLDFTFYVDNDYNILRYFEIWMDYIGSGADTKGEDFLAYHRKSPGYYRRFRFPNQYKTDGIEIVKFERDYKKALSYQFVNAFPKGMTAIPVSYGSAELLKVTMTINYDRYIVFRGDLESIATRLRRSEENT